MIVELQLPSESKCQHASRWYSTSSKVFVIGQIVSQFSCIDRRAPPPPLSPPPKRYKTSSEMQNIEERQKRE